ncbi:MAG: toll/interleukin-1 receptor domain-containing protein [Bacteroidetes bacterium]|nr:toll/interleukin-1 receptor domain-containing protein [Bacteroidota bacterium]
MSSTIFFSYSRENSETVLELAKELRSAGADIWLDQLDIKPGTRWDQSIEDALASSQTLLVVLSKAAVGSNNVMDEVSYALEEGKTVVPVLLEECEIPFRLRRLQFADFTVSHKKGMETLTRALGLKEEVTTKLTTDEPEPMETVLTPPQVKEFPKPSPKASVSSPKKKSKLPLIIGGVLAVIVAVFIIDYMYNGGGAIPEKPFRTNNATDAEWNSTIASKSIEELIDYIIKYGENDEHYEDAQGAIDDLLPEEFWVTYKEPPGGNTFFKKVLYTSKNGKLQDGEDDGYMPLPDDILISTSVGDLYDKDSEQLYRASEMPKGKYVRVFEVTSKENKYISILVGY